MKTKLFLAAALVFSLTIISCGNKKNAATVSDTTEQVCDSACCKTANEACCAGDSVCSGTCDNKCSGNCEKTECPKKNCDSNCANK